MRSTASASCPQVGIWEQITLWELPLLRWINTTWTHPVLDGLCSLGASFDLLKWPLLVAVLLLLWKGGFRGRVLVVLMALCLLIGDAGINWAIKRAADRPRPHEAVEGVRRVRPDALGWRVEPGEVKTPERGRSFTSGHVCNNTALAFLLMRTYPAWGGWAWLWALFIAYARVYTGDHYPSDVLASLLLGSAYTAGICCAAGWLWQQWAPRLFPRLHERYPSLLP